MGADRLFIRGWHDNRTVVVLTFLCGAFLVRWGTLFGGFGLSSRSSLHLFRPPLYSCKVYGFRSFMGSSSPGQEFLVGWRWDRNLYLSFKGRGSPSPTVG